MILLCFDGSDDAREAADRTAALFPGMPVTVLTVWEPYLETLASTGFGLGFEPPLADVRGIDAETGERARRTAEDGATRVRRSGSPVEARTEQRDGSVYATVLTVADELGADAIVLGTRGHGGVASLLLGSVSHAVVQHADRPVVIVPAPAIARARRTRGA